MVALVCNDFSYFVPIEAGCPLVVPFRPRVAVEATIISAFSSPTTVVPISFVTVTPGLYNFNLVTFWSRISSTVNKYEGLTRKHIFHGSQVCEANDETSLASTGGSDYKLPVNPFHKVFLYRF